ncbi:cyclic AMP-dependent transcription factor ATF-7a isoform X4 [Esox lucius]|uniref:cyclic AMP-dependent transcription factor ATF-7a isoform X4 n=1 Tax=Esox lucius TaxID=8010 RepID=UPI001476DAE4|nr:cyclic AMP-dependent transcription factor ATF-7a isoform X4 [Esox lucius]
MQDVILGTRYIIEESQCSKWNPFPFIVYCFFFSMACCALGDEVPIYVAFFFNSFFTGSLVSIKTQSVIYTVGKQKVRREYWMVIKINLPCDRSNLPVFNMTYNLAMIQGGGECQIPREKREGERGATLNCKLYATMGDDRPFVCTAPGCGQRFTNEDHLAVHKHKHEMTLKFGPARTDSVIIQGTGSPNQTPTPTRFLKNCEEVGLFNELDTSFAEEFRKAQEDDDKRSKNPLPVPNREEALDMSLQTPSGEAVKVKEEEPVEVDSTPPGSPDSFSSMSDSSRDAMVRGRKDTSPRPALSSAPTPTIVRPGSLPARPRPGSLPLHMGFDGLQPTMPSPTSVITPTPPSNRTMLSSPTGHYPMMMHLPNGLLPGPVQIPSVISLARPMHMVPNIPGIPGPPLGGGGSGSNSPSGYSTHSEAKMRLKAALAQQSSGGQMGGVAGSPMHPQRMEQSQLLVQHPDAPSPAQPQVSPAQPTGGRRRRATEDDPDDRRQRFLERNRAAASRCRQKRKIWVNSLEKKAEELTSMNVSLANEVSLLRNEVAHLKQLLLAHKNCPVTALQKKAAYIGDGSTMKDMSEPVGSPAAVIQHSSLPSPSPSSGSNGMSSRAAAEAVAMSVLAEMGQHQLHQNQPRRGERDGGRDGPPSHIVMATQSHHSDR